MSNKTSGLKNYGGTINAENIAIGYRAQAIKIVRESSEALTDKGLTELAEKLNNLMEEIEAHGTELPDQKSTAKLIEKIGSNLPPEEKNDLDLRSWLALLVEETKSVAQIAGAAIALKDLIVKLL